VGSWPGNIVLLLPTLEWKLTHSQQHLSDCCRVMQRFGNAGGSETTIVLLNALCNSTGTENRDYPALFHKHNLGPLLTVYETINCGFQLL